MKGTIAHCADSDEDHRRALNLLASQKDRAENVMIVTSCAMICLASARPIRSGFQSSAN
nr:chorismate-binding protein [Bradyrhizobium japonicum]